MAHNAAIRCARDQIRQTLLKRTPILSSFYRSSSSNASPPSRDHTGDSSAKRRKSDGHADENVCLKELDEWVVDNISIPRRYSKFILAEKHQLERETGTVIQIPESNKKTKEISIQVSHQSNDTFTDLQSRIARIIETHTPITHFVSLPIFSDEIAANMGRFSDDVLEKISSSVRTQHPYKLHLTLFVLKLLSDEQIALAAAALDEFKTQLSREESMGPLKGTMKNLKTLKTSARGANVIYSEFHLADGSDRIQKLADDCFNFFIEKGLTYSKWNHGNNSVFLHCTVINSKWARKPKPLPFSQISEILADDFELRDFGECVIGSIQLNKLQSINNRYVNEHTVNI